MAATVPPEPRGPLDARILGLSDALQRHLVACGALALVVAGAVLVQAEAISRYLPRLIDDDQAALAPMVACLVAAAVVRGAAAWLTDRSATEALITTRTVQRARVLDHLARLRPDARPAMGPARAGMLATSAVDALEPWVRSYVPSLTLAVAIPALAGLRILGADPLSAVILAIVIPLIPIFMVLIGKATEAHANRQWEALQRLSTRFLDVITGLPTLRLFGRADAQVDRVRVVTDRYRSATMRTLRVAFISALVLEVLATLSVALLAVSLGARLTGGSVSLERALLVLLLAPECLLPIRRVGAAFHAATAGLDAAVELTAATELPTVPEGSTTPPATGSLVARQVTVTDPSRGVRLDPIDIEVAAGEVVAVTGPSGSGKSTLLDVLRGSLPVDGGQALLGGTPVMDLTLADRAAAIRWVAQSPNPLGDTVLQSVGLGHPEGPETEAASHAALDQVGLTDLAQHRPGEISGGEQRRLALARALVAVHLGTARFLLLDEPTAQLDSVSAARVIAAIRWSAGQGVGVVVATHDHDLESMADARVTIEAARRPAPAEFAASSPAAPVPATQRAMPVRPDIEPPIEATSPAEADGPVTGDGGALRWLLRSARPQRARLIGAQTLGVLTEACAVGLAATAAWLIVKASEQPSFADLAVAAVAVRAFGVSKGFFRYADRLASHDATLRLLAELRATVVARLVHLAPTGLPRSGRGELLTRLVDDIDRLQDFFLRFLGPVISLLLVAAGTVVMAGLIDPLAGVVLAVAVVLTGVVLPTATYRGARRRGQAMAEARGAANATVIDLAEHGDELVACGAEPDWRIRIEDQSAVLDRLGRAHGRSGAVVVGLSVAAPALTCAAVTATAMWSAPELSGPALGVLVLVPLTIIELLGPLSAAGNVLALVQGSAERVLAVLGRPDPVTDPVPDQVAPLPDTADLDLAGVDVGWRGQQAQVTGIDLAVGAGDRVVITGPSGSGKSTIAATLVRFLDPLAGSYRVGGVEGSDLGGEGVRRRVTWCQQEPWFADSTLADNLRIARANATDDELRAALGVVHLDHWFRGLPDGLATRLERDAGTMSGGERQRLALARALLGGHGAIVLDEPTAHLDQDTAEGVLADLLTASKDQAVVVIAHGDISRGLGPTYALEPQERRGTRWRAAGTTPGLVDP